MDLLLTNARILTVYPDQPEASAIAIRDGRVLALGGSELRKEAGPRTRVEDMGGALILPGLVDAHIHWMWTALSMTQVSLVYLPSKREVLDRLARSAEDLPPGQWLVGSGWAQGDWQDTGGVFPSAADLDAIVPDNPVYLKARSGHAGWVNTTALRVAGISAQTPDPPGGTIQRDGEGRPTGIFFEEAMELVACHVPEPTVTEVVEAMEAAQPAAWKSGLVGVHDYDRPMAFDAMQRLRERGTLGLRILKQINDPYIAHAHALGLRQGFGDDWLRIGALKMFADGALGSVTALMIEPHEGTTDDYGIRIMEKDTMRNFAVEATRRGFASTIHAIGDLAVRDTLDILEDARAEEARLGIPRHQRRHRIEHTQLVHPDDLGRLAELDVIASIQPIHATADIDMADRHWGARARYGYDARTQLDRGAVVVFGSDAPVEPFDPLIGIHAAVTRRRADGYPGPEGWYPECRVTVEEAIHAYTAACAFAAGTEATQGRLAPGYWADLVRLDRDITRIDPHEIKDAQVLGTMIAGEWKWQA